MCTYVYLCMCVCMRVVMLLVLCVSRVITFRFLQASPSRRKLISFAVALTSAVIRRNALSLLLRSFSFSPLLPSIHF